MSHRPRFDLVVNTFARDAFTKGKLTVYGGSQYRPNVHVRDVAHAIMTVIDAPIKKVTRQVFNVGCNLCNHTISELALLTSQVFEGTEVKIDERLVDNRNYRVNFNKLREQLAFGPSLSVLDGLKELKQVFEDNHLANLDDVTFSNIEALKAS